MAKMKELVPENPFISFMKNNKKFNGMIVGVNRREYSVKYYPNYPQATNFFSAGATIKLPKLFALPYTTKWE